MGKPYYTLEKMSPERSIGYLIKRCGVLMTQIGERRFNSQPISFFQWMILIRLTICAHASPTELSDHLGYDMGALTRVVDELEKRELVRRERSREDRRAVQIALTPEGRRLANVGARVVIELLNELVEPFSIAEIDALIANLQKLLVRMQDRANQTLPSQPKPKVSAGPPKRAAGRRNARS